MSNISKVSVNGKGYNICDDYARTEYVKMSNGVSRMSEMVTENSGKIQMLSSDVSKNTNDITVIKSTIGSGELTTTAKDLIGAINEVKESGGSGSSGEGPNLVPETYFYMTKSGITIPPKSFVHVEASNTGVRKDGTLRQAFGSFKGIICIPSSTDTYVGNSNCMIIQERCYVGSDYAHANYILYNNSETEQTVTLSIQYRAIPTQYFS